MVLCNEMPADYRHQIVSKVVECRRSEDIPFLAFSALFPHKTVQFRYLSTRSSVSTGITRHSFTSERYNSPISTESHVTYQSVSGPDPPDLHRNSRWAAQATFRP